MNKTAASEWLRKAYHDLSSADILFREHHFTDSISVDLHYAIEKMFKSVLAYENKKISKTHDLLELYTYVKEYVNLRDEELDVLDIATEYHIHEAYPGYKTFMPERTEIEKVLGFAKKLLDNVCKALGINTNLVKC